MSNGRFVGNVPFGNYLDKAVTCTTFNKNIFLHIKDRQKHRSVSLKASEYAQLLKLKDRVFLMLDRASKCIAKENRNCHSEMEDSYIIPSETDDDDDESQINENVISKKITKKRKPTEIVSETESETESESNKENIPVPIKKKSKSTPQVESTTQKQKKKQTKQVLDKSISYETEIKPKKASRPKKGKTEVPNLIRSLSTTSTLSSVEA